MLVSSSREPRHAFVAVALLLLLASAAASTHASSTRDLLVLDCTGGLHLGMAGPGITVDVNLQWLLTAHNWLVNAITTRARTISENEISRRFIPTSVAGFVNALSGVDAVETEACPRAFSRTFWTDSMGSFASLFLASPSVPVKIDLPATCDYTNVAVGEACTFKLQERVTGTDILVAMKECPTTGFPFVSISCEGEYCSTLYQPCSSNSDCSATQSCQELISKEKIIGFLKNASLITDEGELSQCDLDELIQDVMTEAASYFDAQPSTVPSTVSVCFPTAATVSSASQDWKLSKEVKPALTPEAKQCLAQGCPDLGVIGDGTCHEKCNNDYCKFDGGDCLVKPHLHCPSTSQYFECSGQGYCSVSDDDNDDDVNNDDHHGPPACTCFNGYSGSDCSQRTESCFSSPQDRVPCSGRGTCSQGACSCLQPFNTNGKAWSGKFCETPVRDCGVDNACNHKGICRGEGLSPEWPMYCECFVGFFGVDCTEGEYNMGWETCPGRLPGLNITCSGRGYPQPQGGTCTCQCNHPFKAPACTHQAGFSCEAADSTDDGVAPGRTDDLGHDDDFWNFSDDKTRASLVCSGVGKCYAAAPEYHFPEMCMCDAGFQGPHCSSPLVTFGNQGDDRWCAGTPEGCNVTQVIVSGPIAQWDGSFADGTSAVDPNRLSGFDFNTPPLTVTTDNGETSLFYHDCNGAVGYTAGNSRVGAAVQAPQVQSILGFLETKVHELQACRAKSTGNMALTAAQFLTRFVPVQPLMWLYEFAAPNTAFDLGSRLSDWLQVHPWDAKWNTMFKMQPPSTCTFEGYQSNPEQGCSFAYSGFGSLLGADLKILASIARCAGSNPFSVATLGAAMSGPAAEALQALAPCNSDSDCDSALECVDLSTAQWLNLDRAKLQNSPRRDPLGMLLFGSENFNEQCSTQSAWKTSIRNLLLAINEKPPGTSDSLKFCSFPDAPTKLRLGLWAITALQDQCLTTGGNCNTDPVTVNGLTSSQINVLPTTDSGGGVVTPPPAQPPPGTNWVKFTVTLPGLSKSQMNADRAAKYRVSVVATLASTNTELSDVSSDDVLIDALHETPGSSRLLHQGRRLSVATLGVATIVQVPVFEVNSVQQAVTGNIKTFAASLGTELAKHGVIAAQYSSKVSVTPGVDFSGGGLGAGAIIGIIIGCVAFVTLAAVGVAWWQRRRRTMLGDVQPTFVHVGADDGIGDATKPAPYTALGHDYGTTQQPTAPSAAVQPSHSATAAGAGSGADKVVMLAPDSHQSERAKLL